MLKRILLLLALSVLCVGSNAWAISYYLDQTNENNTGTSGPWATVTLSDYTHNIGATTYDAVYFVVDPIESSFGSLGSNFGLQTFYFNENTAFGGNLKIGGVQNDWTINYDKNAGGGFGKFEFEYAGKGSSRMNPLEFYVYGGSQEALTIENFTSILSPAGYLFAAHIADYAGGKSAKFATVGTLVPSDPPPAVPEPGTLLLLGSGLAGLGAWKRRRKS